MIDIHDKLRSEFVGDVIRHTKGGRVFCNANSQSGKVEVGPHGCPTELTAGDAVIVEYEKDHTKGDDDWFEAFRYCTGVDAEEFINSATKRDGVDQVIVEGKLEPFEGIVEGEFYDDAVRLIDVEIVAYSPASEEN